MVIKITNKSKQLYFCMLILTLTALAWVNRFIQDDAFISFRYAKNLCSGHGLVYNIGDKVEGYTNFLWTLIIAGGMKIGFEPIFLSQLIGIILYPFSLLLIYRTGALLFKSPRIALCSVLLAATNYSFICYATGGLETHMQAFLFILILFLNLIIERDNSDPTRLLLSATLGLVFLLRMDSAIIIAPILLYNLYQIISSSNSITSKISRGLCICLPALLIAGTWLVWKMVYYGKILPNTYVAKNPGFGALIPGLYFLILFFTSYGFFLFAFPVFNLLKNRTRISFKPYMLIAISSLWMAYIIKNGGGFMEFRFMVPVIPFLAIIAAWILNQAFRRHYTPFIWVAIFMVISFFHSTRTRLYGVETIKGLQSHVTTGKWMDTGKLLHFLSAANEPVIIATTAAGALPYYSDLTTIDILGLNDVWIAENGSSTHDPNRKWLGAKPGHQKKATLDYLVERKVHLLIGHPHILKTEVETSNMSVKDFAKGDYLTLDPAPFPKNARLVRIPLNDSFNLIAVYLTKHPVIDNLIDIGEWEIIIEPHRLTLNET